jgi:tetratricopeptide (TPR) repeat protein
LLAESARIFEAIGDRWGIAVAFEGLSYSVVRRNPAAAAGFASRSLAIRSELGDTWGISMALMALGTASRFRGDPAVAREHYNRSLDARTEFGVDRIGIAQCIWNIAATALFEGNHEEAMQRFRDAAALSREVGDLGLAARCLISTARAARAAGRPEDARRSLDDGLALSVAIGAREEQAGILAEMAGLALDNADAAAAQQAAEHALALDRTNPCAVFALARIELAVGTRSRALRTLQSALRYARERQVDSVIVDIALTMAEVCIRDHQSLDAITLARSVLSHHYCYQDRRARAESVLRELNIRDGQFRPRGAGDPAPPIADVVADVLARSRRSSPRAAGADFPRPRPAAVGDAGHRSYYRSRTQARDVLKLPAAMCAK